MQVVISDTKVGKAYKVEGKDTEVSTLFVGKRVGDVVDGDVIGLSGYALEITGGSDKAGVPMRKDVTGVSRRRILITSPPGYKPKENGKRRRKTVRGHEISTEISQINVKITEYGRQPIEKIFAPGEEPESA
ncbi:MAG: 30S ribosomal protein S6e [Candidatus Methanophagaceae archaeon]|jgi:small subunit ribosomal protein S6e|nr:MAG: 30S ribosomal protein S6e [Methanophagales archaeon]KAF5433057.1 small subunit ribosomal protein S6e [Methanophagales archaeon]